jgi:transposase-like protein
MGKQTRRSWSRQQKQEAVSDYVSGRQTAAEIAADMDVPVGQVYRWKTQLESRKEVERLDELEREGQSPEDARRIRDLELQLEEYKRKLAEQTLINDLLKKVVDSKSSQSERELTGLINTARGSALRRKPVK